MGLFRKMWRCLLGVVVALAGFPGPSQTCIYDANGNLQARSGQTFTYDAENRLRTVTANGQTTTFSYNGDGQLVKKVAPEGTTLYVGPHYEIRPQPASPPPTPQPTPTPRPGVTRRVRLPLVFNGYWTLDGRPVQEVKYYLVGGQRIASRTGSAGPVTYYYHDHLGSTVSSSGGESTRYWPFGATRSGSVGTAYRFTGQRQDVAGLYFYQARWYDSTIGRFIQPDTVVPSPGNPQSLNRYSYVLNQPLRYTDPTGHCPMCIGAGIGALLGAGIAWIPQFTSNLQNGKSWDQAALNVDWGKVAAGAAGGAVSGATLGIGTAIGAGAIGTMALGGIGGILGGQAAAATEATWNEAARWSQGQEWDGTRWFKEATQEGLFDKRTAFFDAAGGVLSAGLGYKLDKVVSGILSRYGDQTFKGGVTVVYMLPGKGSQGQFGLRWDGRTVTLPASEFENMMKKLAGGTFEVSAEALEQLFEKLLNENINPSNAGGPACP